MITLSVKSSKREQLIDITLEIQRIIDDAGVISGFVVCFVPHTTAAITINENADPDVKSDIIDKLRRLFPQSDRYVHAEGNSDAHLKASLTGGSETVLIADGRLVLGTWQGLYFCEYDGPRTRNLHVKIVADA